MLETTELEGPIGVRLVALAGPGTRLHDRHGIYLDLVGVGIPFLPLEPLWHAADVRLNHFNVLVLDVADVLVSKLKRYVGTDREDIRQMIDGGHVDHARMLARLLDVIEWHKYDGRSDALPAMAERFNQVERDWFGVEETTIDLPDEVFR